MRGITSTLASALAFVIAFSSPSVAPAQDGPYPSRPVRLLVASGPGGNPDILARLLADRMSKDFGKPFVVENVPGVGGVLAATTAAKAAPDGYTLMIGDTGNMAMEQLGMVMKENGTARYVEFTKHDSERYGEIVRRLGLQAK
jgi:tripartite-type tricarboxylate transporter receptor subunit TctC